MYLDGCVGEMELAHMYIIYTHVLYDCVCMYLDGCVGEMARSAWICVWVCMYRDGWVRELKLARHVGDLGARS